MTRKLIGLYSPAPQSGKSTVAEHLCRLHGFQQIPFAGPLKEMTDKFLELLGYDEGMRTQMLYGRLKEKRLDEIDCTPRHLMQCLGTEWGRDCVDEDVWVKVAMARAQASSRHVVFDDLRFPNEFRAIREAGGICVKVTRPGVERQTDHVSEGQLDHEFWDSIIFNDGSIEGLRCKVDRLVRQ